MLYSPEKHPYEYMREGYCENCGAPITFNLLDFLAGESEVMLCETCRTESKKQDDQEVKAGEI
ncbi:MAG: hypothetical protein PHW65_00160 [Dehalococcoidales bacterium]|nr:hypothetical protein [Dehalococcoidales bacterium]